MSRNDKLIANLAAARKRAEDAVDELRIEDELADGFRSRNGDLTLQDAITALNTLITALPTPPVAGEPREWGTTIGRTGEVIAHPSKESAEYVIEKSREMWPDSKVVLLSRIPATAWEVAE